MIMKKLLLLLLVLLVLGCSSEDGSEEMCCGTPVSVLIDSYHKMYGELLGKDGLSDSARGDLEAEYSRALEKPCEKHIRNLENAGASCSNPN